METSTRAARATRRLVLEATSLAALCLVAAIHSLAIRDVEPYDETHYLTLGLLIPHNGPSGFGWGPLYADVFYVWSRAVADPVAVALLGAASASVIFIACVWLAIRLHAGPEWAFVGAAVVLVMPVTYIQAGVGRAAGGLVVLAVAAAFRWRSPGGLATGICLLWLAAGFRPEWAYLASALSLVMIGGLLFSFVRDRGIGAHLRRWGPGVLVVLATMGVLVVVHGSPFADSRLWASFSAYFALMHAGEGYDMAHTAADAMAAYFPGAGSVIDALTVNPSAMGDFLLSNVQSVPDSLEVAATPLAIDGLPRLPAVLLALVVACGVVATAVLSRQQIAASARGAWSASAIRRQVVPLVMLAGVLIAGLAPVLLLHPTVQYLAVIVGLLTVGTAVFLATFSGGKRLGVVVLVGVLTCWVAVATICVAGLAQRISAPPPLAGSLHALGASGGKHTLLSGDYGAGLVVYVPGVQLVDAEAGSDAVTFAQRLNAVGVDAVFISPALDHHPWAQLSGYREFVADPRGFGFHPAVPGAQLWLRDQPAAAG